MSVRFFEFTNTENQNLRSDIFLYNCLASDPEFEYLTRSQIKKLFQTEKVSIGDKTISKAGTFLKPEQVIKVALEERKASHIDQYEFPLEIKYEDQHLLVVNKPSGLTVHPGAGNSNQTLLNALAYYLKGEEVFLVHRLDKDTSGLLLVAKNELARKKLTEQFLDRSISRIYWALVMVTPRANRIVQKQDSGKIETLIGRHPKKRIEMAVVKEAGRLAVTNWQVLEKYNYAYLLQLKLETGRTHQIRVHMEHIASPIIGDPLYGNFDALPLSLKSISQKYAKQALHAKSLEFIHPDTQEKLKFESNLPQDFEQLINAYRSFS